MSPKNCSLAYDLSRDAVIDLEDDYVPNLVLLTSEDKQINKTLLVDASIEEIICITGKVTVSF